MDSSTGLQMALNRARRLGVLGPGPIEDHISHAGGFMAALEEVPVGSVIVDLGSGGGIPGLVIADARPDLRLVLLDALERRVALLEEAVEALGWDDRVIVLHARAEDVGRDPAWRGTVDAVTARLFGPPATVAECAAPLLRVGGVLIVSEPPEQTDRWPIDGLSEFGLEPAEESPAGMQVLRQVELCPDKYPRRVGIPAKRPRF